MGLHPSVAMCRSGWHATETAAYPRGGLVLQNEKFSLRSDAEAGRHKRMQVDALHVWALHAYD